MHRFSFKVYFLLACLAVALFLTVAEKDRKICQEDPTLKCVRAYLSKEIHYPAEEKDYWSFAERLAKAGLYDESLHVVSRVEKKVL